MAKVRTSKASQKPYLIPGDVDKWPDAALYKAAAEQSEQRFLTIALVRENQLFRDYWLVEPEKPWEQTSGPRRLIVLWQASTVAATAVLDWRSALIEESGVSYRIEQMPVEEPAVGWAGWLRKLFEQKLAQWAVPVAAKEPPGLEMGSKVRQRDATEQEEIGSYDPAFVAVPLGGGMSEVMDTLDLCKRRYRDAIGGDVGTRRKAVLEKVQEMLMFDPVRENISDPAKIAEEVARIQTLIADEVETQHFLVERRKLPKVLLLGPSGSGKTLVARYLAWRTSPGEGDRQLSRPFKRVSIPEYLGDEERFAFDVLGYTASAYTGARPSGSRGILLERLGGVVFFDEIGEASPPIQSKLLPYLDDYQVTPVGWEGEPVTCPMLIVAATNRPIDEWAKEETRQPGDPNYFRNDLYRRFTDVVYIPPLRDRLDELPALVDAMLQMEQFNPGRLVQEVGEQAMRVLRDQDYDKGNFRTLESLVRIACERAMAQGRDYLVKSDLEH